MIESRKCIRFEPLLKASEIKRILELREGWLIGGAWLIRFKEACRSRADLPGDLETHRELARAIPGA